MDKKSEYQGKFKHNPALREVLQLYCDGFECEGIANIRGTEPGTVRCQFDAIRAIFEVNNMTRAVVYGLYYEIIIIRHIDE